MHGFGASPSAAASRLPLRSLGLITCTLSLMAAAPLALHAQGVPAAPAATLLPVEPDPGLELRFGSRAEEPFFTSSDAWLAVGFVAGTLAMVPLDRAFADALQDSTLQAHEIMRDVAGALRFLGFPGSVIIGTSMYAAGRLGSMPRVAAIGLHGTEAVLLDSPPAARPVQRAGRRTTRNRAMGNKRHAAAVHSSSSVAGSLTPSCPQLHLPAGP
jgi:hypothetical protein